MNKIICDLCQNPNKNARRMRFPLEQLNITTDMSRYKHKIIDLCAECEVELLTATIFSIMADIPKISQTIIQTYWRIQDTRKFNTQQKHAVRTSWKK